MTADVDHEVGILPKVNTYCQANVQHYKGVCPEEYFTDEFPIFKAEGYCIFQKRHWMLQQDSARVHQTKISQAHAEDVASGGQLHPWPPDSSDHNLIENVFALEASELAVRPLCHTKDNLEDAIQQVSATFTPERLALFV